MEQTLCPVECLNYDADDFLTKHSTFMLTLVGSVSAALGVVFSYCLKSRCSKINMGCISCDRVPPNEDVTITSNTSTNTENNNNDNI